MYQRALRAWPDGSSISKQHAPPPASTDHACYQINGTCLNTDTHACDGAAIRVGFCPGNKLIQCCPAPGMVSARPGGCSAAAAAPGTQRRRFARPAVLYARCCWHADTIGLWFGGRGWGGCQHGTWWQATTKHVAEEGEGPCLRGQPGTCIDTHVHTCVGAETVSGFCPGDFFHRCCPTPGYGASNSYTTVDPTLAIQTPPVFERLHPKDRHMRNLVEYNQLVKHESEKPAQQQRDAMMIAKSFFSVITQRFDKNDQADGGGALRARARRDEASTWERQLLDGFIEVRSFTLPPPYPLCRLPRRLPRLHDAVRPCPPLHVRTCAHAPCLVRRLVSFLGAALYVSVCVPACVPVCVSVALCVRLCARLHACLRVRRSVCASRSSSLSGCPPSPLSPSGLHGS